MKKGINDRSMWQWLFSTESNSPRTKPKKHRSVRFESLERRELMATSIDALPVMFHPQADAMTPALVSTMQPASVSQPMFLAATAVSNVTAIDVISGSNSNISRSGWQKLNVDLNMGAGGKFVYIVYQTGSGTPITGLQVVAGKNAAAPSGFTKINVDLNAGAGGEYLYLCYRKSSSGVPINGLDVISGRNSLITHSNPLFTKINVDLNQGCGADTPYIYLNYRTKGSMIVSAPVRDALAGISEGFLQRQFDQKSFSSDASDTYKKGLFSYTVSTSVTSRFSPINRLDLDFTNMSLLRGPDRLVVDLSFSSAMKGEVSGKIKNIVSASTKFTAVANITARVEFTITRNGSSVTATPKIIGFTGKVSDVSFSNDVANTIKGYFTKHINASIEKKAASYSDNINNALASAAANGKFTAELKKLLA